MNRSTNAEKALRKTLCLIISFLMILASVPNLPAGRAYADVGDVPDHDKLISANTTDGQEDGTYTLELYVVGDADTSTTASNVNVMIVYDVSTSMCMYWVPSATGSYGTTSANYMWYDQGGQYLNNNRTVTDNTDVFLLYRNTGGNNYTVLQPGENYSGTVYRRGNNGRYSVFTGTRVSARRADVAEEAVYEMVHSLFTHQDSSNPENIQVSFITFSGGANPLVNWTSNESDITSRLSQTGLNNSKKLTYSSGTNYEDALKGAISVLANRPDDDPTFVMFVTDGAATQTSSHSNKTDEYYENAKEAFDEALTIENTANTTLYGIYAFGNEADYLDDLIYYAHNGSERTPSSQTVDTDYYYAGGDTDALKAAIAEIFSAIVKALGINSVTINDGTTSQVEMSSGSIAHLLDVDESSYKYWLEVPIVNDQFERVDMATGDTITYTVTDIGSGQLRITWTQGGTNKSVTVEGTKSLTKFRYRWTGANELYNVAPPPARFEDGAVIWDLDKQTVGTLLDGVKYSVTFTVYPSQETYDYIANLKNGVMDYDEIVALGLDDYIKENGPGSYSLITNTTATMSYDDSREGGGPGSTTFDPLEPVPTEASKLDLEKTWIGTYGEEQNAETIDLYLKKDGVEQDDVITLTKDGNKHVGSYYIAIGLLTVDRAAGTIKLYDTGHDYQLVEKGDLSYHWELAADILHPMLINGEVTMLKEVTENIPEMEDNTYLAQDEKEYYKFGGIVYQTVGGASEALSAVNVRRSNFNLTKVVEGEDAPQDTWFTFTLKLTSPNASAMSFSVYGDGGYRTMDEGVVLTEGLDVNEQDNRYYDVPSGTTITVRLKKGWNLRFPNVITGTDYEVVETVLPDNFAFGGSAVTAVNITSGEAATSEDWTATDETRTLSGSIDVGNAQITATFTNKYELEDVEITKVWNDNGDQDGLRPTPDEFKTWLTLKAGEEDVTSAYAEKLTVTDNGDNTYTAVWTGLPLYVEGEAVVYSVTETVGEGYTSDTTTVGDKGTITNTHTPMTTSITVTKNWDDANDQDGKRSGVAATVTLFKTVDGTTSEVGTVNVTTADDWSKTWTDLPVYEDGKAITYSVVETLTTANGYTSDTTTAVIVPNGESKEITNSYAPEKTNITVTKNWDDADDQDGKRSGVEATVTLFKTVDGTTSEVETVNVTADDDWSKVWTDLPVYEGGKAITYSVVETLTTANGYTSDTTTAVVVPNGGSKEIKNSYTPEKTSITVTKNWNDNDDQDGKRSGVAATVTLFKTVDGTTSEVGTVNVTTADDWSKTWTDLPVYEDGKAITYSVVETLTTANGYTSDTTTAVTVPNGGTKEIANTHVPETTSIEAEKIWKDGSTVLTEAPEDITLHLNKQVGTGSATVVPDQDKTISEGASGDDLKVTWTDLPVYENGSRITYSVTEDTVAGYTTTITGDSSTGFVITNSKVTVTGALLSKTVTAANPAASSTFAFSAVEVTDETGETVKEGGWTGTGEITFSANESDSKTVTFDDITFDGPGVHYYKITETTVPGGWTATYPGGKTFAIAKITVTKDPATGELSAVVQAADISNAYSVTPTTFTLGASKTLVVQSGNNAPDVSGEYDLILKDANGTVIDTRQNPDGDGTPINFTELTFSAAGTYTYTVEESGEVAGVTNGTASYTVVITVTDKGDGTLEAQVTSGSQITEFTNTYNAAPVSLELKASKTLADDGKADNPPDVTEAYTLTLTPVEDAPMPKVGDTEAATVEKKNPDGNGTAVSFGSITFDTPGEFSYTVTESGTVAGVTNGTSSYTVTVKVTDNGEGQLVYEITSGSQTTAFTNTYSVSPVSVTPEAAKSLTGRKLQAGEFSFTLTGKGVNETKTNDAAGKVEFSSIEYDTPGTYTYTIKEEAGDLDNVTYDTSTKTVVVTVTDNGRGALEAEVKYDGATTVPVFNNTYVPDPTEANISVEKALTGRDLNAGEFSFTMTRKSAPDGAAEFEDMTAANDAAGLVSFDAIEYDVAGTYVYEITEDPGELGGVTYSSEKIEVTVEVTYDEDAGIFSAEVIYPEDKTFNNTYAPEPTEATIEAMKVLEGRTLNNGEFEFTLSDDSGEIQKKSNAADGTVSFDTIAYDEPGTYTYTITEVKGQLGGITYDESEFTVTVIVTDDLEGALHAEVRYAEVIALEDGSSNETALPEGEVPTFTNTYEAEPTSESIEVEKALSGRDLKAGEFSFSLLDVTGEDAVLVDTAENTAAGKVIFDEIEYTEVGTYVYNITEIIPEDTKGVTYDTATIEITVVVTDDLEGSLVADVRYPEDTEFNNTYEASGTFAPETKKILEGKDLEDGEFTFVLEGPEDRMPEASTVTNSSDGTVKFGEITFDETDIGNTYEYTITETEGSERFVTYDDNTITVSVTVKDNGDGTLSFDAEYSEAEGFINSFEIVYGDLRINKTVDVYDDVNRTSFVFSITAVLDGVTVYDDVVSLDFDATGTLSAEIIGKIPVGSIVTVTEIYTSGSYELTSDEPDAVTIVENETAEVNFTNTYNNNLNQGYGILNEYSREEGGEWTHNERKPS